MKSVNRKCPKCGHWNNDEDNCTSCGYVLNPKIIRKQEIIEEERKFSAKPPDSIDIFLQKFKNSRFFLIRWFYYILLSVWLVFGVTVSFILYMVAGTVG